jgi:ABC-2 type transport system permease protein
MMWLKLVALVRKELLQTMRDRRMVALLVAAPFIQTIVFGFAVDLEVDRVGTVIVDRDATHESRRHARRLLADGTLKLAGRERTGEAAIEHLVAGRATLAVIVPRGFSTDVARGRPGEVQLLVDGSDPNRSGVASGAAQEYFAAAGAELRPPGAGGPVEVRSRIFYNPTLDTAVFMVPGVAAMLLLVITTVVGSMGLARERETGTLEQVLVSPVRPWLVMAGKIIPFLGFGLIDFMLAMVVGAYLFDMPMRGSFLLLVGATLLYLLSTLGAGLLVATVSRSQQQAFLGSFLFVLPVALLSGILTPIRSMPSWLKTLTLANPLRHYAEIMRATLLKGADLDALWPSAVALALLGLGLFGTAAVRFHKTLG